MLWRRPTLDADRITAYLEQWEDRLDLFHPEQPAFQCGELNTYNRGPEALHPSSLGGETAQWFTHALVTGVAPWTAAAAARNLLCLLAYDVAGIKGAAAGDPRARSNKVYGAKVGPVANGTHLHLEVTGGTLKDTLMLSVPPARRAVEDRPVWERESPPAAVRDRRPTGRLDIMTWPSRRIRLHADEDGRVDRLAVHDGDRFEGDTWTAQRRHDPMTAWTRTAKNATVPLVIVSDRYWNQPWAPAVLLHEDNRSKNALIEHVLAIAERGVLDDDTPLRVITSCVLHANRHRSNIQDIPMLDIPYGDIRLLADSAGRAAFAQAARYTYAIQSKLITTAVATTGRPAQLVAQRLEFTDLADGWEAVTRGFTESREEARKLWEVTLRDEAERLLTAFPSPLLGKAPILQKVFARTHVPSVTDGTDHSDKPAKRHAGGRPAPTYTAFGHQYTLRQLSALPQCVVSLPTLSKRVAEGWDVEQAATTPARQPRPGS